MRQKRAKAYRKLMALYTMSFGFRQPYQVLVDSEMCKSATDSKIELSKQLGVVLQGLVKLRKTQQPAVDLAKTFERRKCNHREPIPGDECVASVVGESNKHRYVIATQSHPLRVKLRGIPGVPIVHVNRSVMVLEPPSDATLKQKESTEEQTLHPTAPDMILIASATPDDAPRKKKKGPRGPNPLSVKKKKAGNAPVPSAKAKGKEKASISSNRATEARKSDSRPGEKRKRDLLNDNDEAEEDRTTDHKQVSTELPHEGGGRKRKRRRKAAVVADDSARVMPVPSGAGGLEGTLVR